MPELAQAPPKAPLELVLADSAEQLPPGLPWLALGDVSPASAAALSLAPVFRAERARLRAAFVNWLGALNCRHASAAWWAHATSAKNLLASRFGNQVLELLGLRLLLADNALPRLGIVGASAAQAEVLRRSGVRVIGSPSTQPPRRPRALYQLLRVAIAWLLRLRWMRTASAGGLHVLTYADGAYNAGRDAFFGELGSLLARRSPPMRCQFHAYLHGALGEVARKLEAAGECAPLYAELEFIDLIAAYRGSRTALAQTGQWRAGEVDGLDLTPLLHEALREDVELGGYFHNLLVRTAARRLATRLKPEVLLYPFENKPLEKMLLLGLREAGAGTRAIGYQHTSVTPRHTTLLFAEGEAAATPLPDRIVTAGAITRAYLERHGRYPAGLLVEGCALRQPARQPLARRAQVATDLRLLLVLSSSALERAHALRLLLDAGAMRPEWQLAVRPHPEFPLCRLPPELRAEVGRRVKDFSSTALEHNLAWADVVVYASSTVGLEAMMAGRPVVNLDLGEALETDPALESASLRWQADSGQTLVAAVDAIAAVDDAQFAMRVEGARAFLGRYFHPVTDERLALLVGMPGA